MTVGELIQKLQHEPADKLVVLSADEEGNRFHLLASVDGNSTYRDGDVHLMYLTVELARQGYTDEDVDITGTPCVVLWP